MQDGQLARRGNLEDDSAASAPVDRGPVEIPVGALNQAGERGFPVGAVKAEKQCELAGGANPEDNACIRTRSGRGGSVEIAVRAQDQRPVRLIAVGDVEFIEGREYSCRRNLVNRSAAATAH